MKNRIFIAILSIMVTFVSVSSISGCGCTADEATTVDTQASISEATDIDENNATTSSKEDKTIINSDVNVDDKGNIEDKNDSSKTDDKKSDSGTKTENTKTSSNGSSSKTTNNTGTTSKPTTNTSTNTTTNTGSTSNPSTNTGTTTNTTTNNNKTWHEAVYKTVNHPAVTKKVNHPAETKVVNHPAETKKINHPAETKQVKVVDKEAYIIEEPVYEWQYRAICNDCGADLTFMSEDVRGDHIFVHLETGGKGSFMTKNVQVQTGTKTVTVPEEFHYETVTVKEAWTETVTVKEAWSETVVVKEAWTETVTVKEAWTEKVLVKEAGWY